MTAGGAAAAPQQRRDGTAAPAVNPNVSMYAEINTDFGDEFGNDFGAKFGAEFGVDCDAEFGTEFRATLASKLFFRCGKVRRGEAPTVFAEDLGGGSPPGKLGRSWGTEPPKSNLVLVE